MKRLLIAALCFSPIAAHAEFSFQPSASNLTHGVNNASQSAFSSASNPAAAASALQNSEDTRFRLGLISLGVGYEVGDVDNFVDDLDRLMEKTDALTVDEVLAITDGDPNTYSLLDEFNDTVLPSAAEHGYLTTSVTVQLLSPLVIASNSLGGAITLDISAGANIRVGVIDDEISLDNTIPTSPTLTANKTSLFIQGGTISEVGLGYSRNVFNNNSGSLYVGGKVKYLNVELGRTTVFLDEEDDTSDVGADFDQNSIESTDVTLDLGILWVSQHYQAGVTILNATSPSFEYPDNTTLSLSCADITGAERQARCNNALTAEDFEMSAQARIEGSWHSASRSWIITGAYDTSETDTPSGDKVQWAVVSAAFSPESWWIPGIRVGQRTNLTGSELNYVTAGLTLFKGFTLDAAMATEKTIIDGDEVPRAAAVNVAFEMRF